MFGFHFSIRRIALAVAFTGVLLVGGVANAKEKNKRAAVDLYAAGESWPSVMLGSALTGKTTPHINSDINLLISNIYKSFPVETDWFLQDCGEKSQAYFAGDNRVEIEFEIINSALAELATIHGMDLDMAMPSDDPDSTARLDKYVDLCKVRRKLRLTSVMEKADKFVFTKHYNLGGSHYAYTEGLSDAQAERSFQPGSALCILEVMGGRPRITTLIEDADGVIRDPDVSWDGKRILFSWKKSDLKDDYHLYEMDIATKVIRQLTEGLGYADYEGIYLPDGDILFNSSRCVQTVDCWWTEVSNLYKCNKDGGNIHRISFDQVHTNYPQVLSDGRVIYTRWDYNDRGQIYPQALFQMNADGTGQTEFYGNNSWFPTTIAHGRGIDGTTKVVCILTGHHSDQRGKLAILDPSKGRQEASGVQLIAPVRETAAVKVDAYGQDGVQFQYPYPLGDDEFIVTYCPLETQNRQYSAPYGIGLVTADGRRELLAYDIRVSCNQPVMLKARKKPMVRPSVVDYRKTSGTYYIQDVYIGPGLEGVERGTVKEIRVVGLDFRVAGIGSNGNRGPAGGALVSTPVAIDNGTWDVKIVHGDAKVYKDGSAFFEVPSRKPVYFQAIDEKGHAVATMRSWSTLQPGENFACIGCHESKDATPARGAVTNAMKAGPQKLTPFYGATRGFSFPKEIQPILDKHCIKCHDNRDKRPVDKIVAVDLNNAKHVLEHESLWRYTVDSPGDGWQMSNFDDSAWLTGKAGLGVVGTLGGKVNTNWESNDVWMRGSFDVPAEMVGDNFFFDVCYDEDVKIYINGVLAAKAKGVVTNYKSIAVNNDATKTIIAGKNTIAVHCRQTEGGQYIDVAVAVIESDETSDKPFSLLADENIDNDAKRRWSDSYLALTMNGKSRDIVNWINIQESPAMLKPYSAGACKSKLISMLEKNHGDVVLSTEELEKIACWIDLLVPYCGDYAEANAWNEEEIKKYERFMNKRKAMEKLDAKSINIITNEKLQLEGSP